MWTYSPRKHPWNYHPPNHMTTSSNSKNCLSSNEPRPILSILLNTRPARSPSKNTSRLAGFPLSNSSKQYCSSRRRKLGNYDPTKITSISTATWSRMSILSPLFLTLLINSEDCQSLSNSTYDGDITISSSNQRTVGRPPSPHHFGCLNLMSCSLECATPQPHSKPSWMISLEIILWRAGW